VVLDGPEVSLTYLFCHVTSAEIEIRVVLSKSMILLLKIAVFAILISKLGHH